MKTLTTNKNDIYSQAYNYILDCIDLTDRNFNPKTDKERLQAIWDIFKSEYGDNVKYYGSIQKAFENWLMGLPSCFNIEYRNHAIIEIAKKWGSLENNAPEKQEEKILNSWWAFIYMRFLGLCKKYKINTTI